MSDFQQGDGPMLLAVSWIFAGIAILLCIARLGIRCASPQTLGWDDAVIAVCLVFRTVGQALGTVAIHYGLGQHARTISLPNVIQLGKYNAISQVFTVLYFPLPKLALVLLVERTLKISKPMRWVIYINLALLSALAIVSVVINFVKCSPVTGNWDPTVDADCWNPHISEDIALAVSAYSAACDFLVAIYPVFRLRGLKMAQSKKITVGVLMGFSIIATAFGIAKCPYLAKLPESKDPSYDATTAVILTELEIDILTMGACLPALGALFRVFHTRSKPTTYEDRMKTSAERLYRSGGKSSGKSSNKNSHYTEGNSEQDLGIQEVHPYEESPHRRPY